jgi:hypothetical protein
MAPPSLVPLGLAAFTLPLGTNLIVTSLIAGRIWYLSPRQARNMNSAQFPTRTGRAAIDIVIESGMLYLAVQIVFVILFAIRHPAQGIVGVIAVQIYVRIPHPLRPRIRCKLDTAQITQGIAPTLILIRVALGMSNEQTRSVRSGPASSVTHLTSAPQVRINTVAFTEGGRLLPAETSVSEIRSKLSDLDSRSSFVENVTTVTV